MKKFAACCTLLLISSPGWPAASPREMQLDVTRDGAQYNFRASFDTPLNPCAAYNFLTDYDAAKQMPGVIESQASREGPNRVLVRRIADESILFFRVRLRSTMEYTEYPYRGVSFVQLSGDSRKFQGEWEIEASPQGSTFRFHGVWEPDTIIPLFIIDHFARNELAGKFNSMAQLAEKRKDELPASCPG